MKTIWVSAALLVAVALTSTPAHAQVDPALVGTWHLQGGIEFATTGKEAIPVI